MKNEDMTSAVFWLNATRLPARINDEQAASLLGFKPHDMARIRKAGLLKTLGEGPSNSVKWYATVEVLRLSSDKQWLQRATKAVSRAQEDRKKEDPP